MIKNITYSKPFVKISVRNDNNRSLLRSLPVHSAVLCVNSMLFVLALIQSVGSGAGRTQLTVLLTAYGVMTVWSLALSEMLVCLPLRLAKVTAWIFGLFATTVAFANAFHFKAFGEQIGVPSIVAALDSNTGEISEFLTSVFTTGNLVFSLSFLITGVLATKILSDQLTSSHRVPFQGIARYRNFIVPVICAIVLVALSAIGLKKFSTFALNNPVLFALQMNKEVMLVKSGVAEKFSLSSAKATGARFVGSDREPAVHILIIGESVTPSHMSLYGYARRTTPRMERDIAEYSRHVINDVCSTQHNTHLSLKDVMTGVADQDGARLWEKSNIISISREAGYRAYWISNQAATGDTDVLSSAWARMADVRKFVTVRGWKEGASFDEKLLDPIKDALNDDVPRKLIIVHMIGAHLNFARRYPDAFARWSNDSEVPDTISRRNDAGFLKSKFNQYDNAVLYTDHVVGEIIQLAQQNRVASIAYFSDHGQNLGEHTDAMYFSMPNGPRQGFEVPLIFWISKHSERELRSRSLSMEGQTSRRVELDSLMHTLLDLYSIDSRIQSRRLSLLRPEFVDQTRRCDRMSR